MTTAKRYRSAYAKFRCGVAPINIETFRYGLNRVPVDQRLCEPCNVVENEFHVIMLCSVFDDIRLQFMISINEFNQDFKNLRTVHSDYVKSILLQDCIKSNAFHF